MKRFQNGDVLLSKYEFEELYSKDGKRQSWEFINHLIRHSKFYYELREIQYNFMPTVSTSFNTSPSYEDFYKIRKSDYELFKALIRHIDSFEPDRPV